MVESFYCLILALIGAQYAVLADCWLFIYVIFIFFHYSIGKFACYTSYLACSTSCGAWRSVTYETARVMQASIWYCVLRALTPRCFLSASILIRLNADDIVKRLERAALYVGIICYNSNQRCVYCGRSIVVTRLTRKSSNVADKQLTYRVTAWCWSRISWIQTCDQISDGKSWVLYRW